MQHEIWEMINVIMHIKMTVFRNRSRTKRNQISEYEMTSTNSCHVQWSLTSFKCIFTFMFSMLNLFSNVCYKLNCTNFPLKIRLHSFAQF